MESSLSTNMKGFQGQTLNHETNGLGHSTFSLQDWTVEHNNLQNNQPAGSSSNIRWNFPPKVNASSGLNILNQNTRNLGVPGASSVFAQQPFQSPADGNCGTRILNCNFRNLGVPCTSNNISLLSPIFQNPIHQTEVPSTSNNNLFPHIFQKHVHQNPIQAPITSNNNLLQQISQNPTENLPALANPMNSSAAVELSSAGQDDFSLSFIVEGGPSRGSSSKNPMPKKSNAATSILGKRSSIVSSSIQDMNNQAPNNAAIMIHDSPAGGRDRQIRRRGRKPDSQKYRELAAAQEKFRDGDLYKKIARGPCMPSQMTNTDLHRMGMSNLPLSNSAVPPAINWSGVGFMNRVNFERNIQGTGFLGQQQISSSSSGQNNQSFLFSQRSQTGLLGDIPMSSSFTRPNNQVLPFFEQSQTDPSGDHQMMTSSSGRQNYENFPILEASQIGFIDNQQTSSFPFVEGSQTGTLCDFGTLSSSNDQNNPSFQEILSLASQTGIQSCNPQETNVLHATKESIEELISDMLSSQSELESIQIDPARLEQYNAELLAAAIQQETETPQQPMDSEDHQQLLVDYSFESAPNKDSFSLDAPHDAGLNVQTSDVAATLGNLAARTNATIQMTQQILQ